MSATLVSKYNYRRKEYKCLQTPITLATTADPVEPTRTLDVMESPAAPADCRVATRPPAGTPPPLAMADTDISLAAREEAAMPDPVKPTALSTGGTAATVMAPPSMATAVLTPMGQTAKAEAGRLDKTVPAFSAPNADPSAEAPEPSAVWANKLSPCELARKVLDTAPPALTTATEDATLEAIEATSVPVPDNAMGTGVRSR